MSKSFVRLQAELQYLALFWKGYFIQEMPTTSFHILNKKAYGALNSLLNKKSIQDLNASMDQFGLKFPFVTKLLLEHINEGLWACPSQLVKPLSHALGRDFPSKDEIEKTLPAKVIFEKHQLPVFYALQKIKNGEGISLLSGYELVRPPFMEFQFKKLYSVDMSYLERIKKFSLELFKKELWKIFKESNHSPVFWKSHYKNVCKNFKTLDSGFLPFGLMLDGVKNNELYLNWILRNLKQNASLLKNGKVVPVVGNVQNLKECKKLIIHDKTIKK